MMICPGNLKCATSLPVNKAQQLFQLRQHRHFVFHHHIRFAKFDRLDEQRTLRAHPPLSQWRRSGKCAIHRTRTRTWRPSLQSTNSSALETSAAPPRNVLSLLVVVQDSYDTHRAGSHSCGSVRIVVEWYLKCDVLRHRLIISSYSNEHKYRPAASPVVTEILKDGRKRLRGANPSVHRGRTLWPSFYRREYSRASCGHRLTMS